MDKQEIVIWLNNNAEKQESEIRSFLLSKIQEEDFKESWQRHYFFKELKRVCGACPVSILKIINDLEKENKEKIKKEDKEHRRWGGYIIAGVIWAFSQSFKKTTVDELIILIIAVVSGFLYYRLKSKIKIKNEIIKIILTAIIILVITSLIIGFLTTLL